MAAARALGLSSAQRLHHHQATCARPSSLSHQPRHTTSLLLGLHSVLPPAQPEWTDGRALDIGRCALRRNAADTTRRNQSNAELVMYRANDPRFRRRLNEIGQTLENANESAQSGIYIFTQQYIKPCFQSVSSGITACIDASCPTLNLTPRERLRRQRGRTRGQAELNFDFYDDWDEEENEALLGWGGNDDVDRMLGASGSYGTVAQTQPARQLGMNYGRGRRKSVILGLEAETDPTVIPGSGGFFGKLFGGKALRYKPSAAGLQEHPGARRSSRDLTEGEALLEEYRPQRKGHGRNRSATASSGQTSDSRSSRGDIFPSDGEDDAVPLDDEFAMVLERRTTQSGGHEADSSSGNTHDASHRRGKRPSAGSRLSTGGRTLSTRSRRSNGSEPQTPIQDNASSMDDQPQSPPSLSELKQEEHRTEQEEEADVQRRRSNAQKLAVERGLATSTEEDYSSKEATPQTASPVIAPSRPADDDV